MTDTAPSSEPTAADQARWAATRPPEPTRWVGWILFAGTMMALMGGLHAFFGFLALLNDQKYLVGKGDLAADASYTVWGWTHLIVGAVILVAGLSLMYGRSWARVAAVVVACVSIVLNFAFMAAYPVYGLITIVIDLLVFWAITVHGKEITYAV